MAIIAKSASLLSARPALSPVPRLPMRSCSTRAAQHTGLKRTVASAKAPADCLHQTATQLTGVAGLLVPLLLSDPAVAATPDGQHLTKAGLVVLESYHRIEPTALPRWNQRHTSNHPAGNFGQFDSPSSYGLSVSVHPVDWVPWLAVEANTHYTRRTQAAQEGAP